MRLFVSVDTDGFGNGIEALQDRFVGASGVRPVAPENVHVTLKFLGEVSVERVPTLLDGLHTAIERTEIAPFEATFGGLGAFPSEEYIRVLWVGVREGGEELTRLHEAIEKRVLEMGFEPAEHAFTPHATVARMDHAGGKDLVQDVLREVDPTLGTREIDSVELRESTLTEDGPEYSTIESIALG